MPDSCSNCRIVGVRFAGEWGRSWTGTATPARRCVDGVSVGRWRRRVRRSILRCMSSPSRVKWRVTYPFVVLALAVATLASGEPEATGAGRDRLRAWDAPAQLSD